MAVSEKFLRNWKFKLNITDVITDRIIKKLILIFNYPSVNPSLTRPNKNITRDRLISSSSSSSSLYVKNINIYFFLFFSFLISFSFPPCSGMSSSSFFFYPLSFLSLLSFTCNYIKVRFFFILFSWFFSLYLFFYFIFNCFYS